MASSFNKIVIVGYVGGNPDSRYLPSGDAVTNFSVATTEKWKGRDGVQPRPPSRVLIWLGTSPAGSAQ